MMGCFCQRKKNKQREETEISAAAGSGGAEALAVAKGEGEDRTLVLLGNIEKVFGLKDLLNATAEVLGKGTFGPSYKVNLEVGLMFVKRLKDVKVSATKLAKMLDRIGIINHENLLPLKAYHCSKDKKFLVYDYMPMGSLSSYLQRNRGAGNGKTPLNWETRFGIIVGVARAIAHLHSLSPATFHGNIKPSNILLTSNFEARVSDYLPSHIANSKPAPKYVDFDGYCAPEVTDRSKLSQKADVYNFGVLLLELLTGKPPIFQDDLLSEKVTLQGWIVPVVEDELTSEVFDLDLLRYENVEEDLVRMLPIAIDCTCHDPRSRPSMAEVRNQIEELCHASSKVCSIHVGVEND